MNIENIDMETWYKARSKMLIWVIAGTILMIIVVFSMKSQGLDDTMVTCVIYGTIGSCGFVFCLVGAMFEIYRAYHPKSRVQLLEERVSELEKMVK